jgi:hypothetical protein
LLIAIIFFGSTFQGKLSSHHKVFETMRQLTSRTPIELFHSEIKSRKIGDYLAKRIIGHVTARDIREAHCPD